MPASSKQGEDIAGSASRGLDGLVAAISTQDQSAFTAFYDATTEKTMSLALRITRQIDLAEEVVGDVYLQVWNQADRFDSSRGNAMAWLMTMCRSRALDALRKLDTMPTIGAKPIADVTEAESDPYPQDLLIAVEERTAIHNALEKLDASQRQLLALAFFRGYSHSELAKFTGLPLGTVKTRVRRALIKLKTLMTEEESEKRETA